MDHALATGVEQPTMLPINHATSKPKVTCLLDILGFPSLCLDKAWLQMVTPANVAQAIGALASLLAMISSLSLIIGHWKYNTSKLVKPTLRLLFVVPIFALDAWACLMLEGSEYDLASVLTYVREVYEAIALLSFMELVLTILGGTEELAKTLEGDSKVVEHFWPLRLVLHPYNAGGEFLAAMLAGIFQYVVVCFGLFCIICFICLLQRFGVPAEVCTKLQAVPGLFKACSCAWALTCLVLFAHEVQHHVPNARLVLKFLSIKGIVFFTFWQAFVINVLDHVGVLGNLEAWVHTRARESDLRLVWWNEMQFRSGLNDLLLCIEVLFFSMLHWLAYPVSEFAELPAIFRRRIHVPSGSPPLSIQDAVNFWDVRGVKHKIQRLRARSGCEHGPLFFKWKGLRKPVAPAGNGSPLLAGHGTA